MKKQTQTHRELRSLRGFAKKYWSLAAICALNAALANAAQTQSTQNISANAHPKISAQKSDSIESSQTELEKISAKVVFAQEEEPLQNAENTSFSQVFTQEQIKNSNSQNIYDFLQSKTTLNIHTNYGNAFTQSIDSRGFGQNASSHLAIIVDGMRFENIDGGSVFLSAIPLESISKIEIIKGVNAAKYGSGAQSVLKITTNRAKGAEISAQTSSYNSYKASASGRIVGNSYNIGAYIQSQKVGGERKIENKKRADSTSENGGISAFYNLQNTIFKADFKHAQYDTKYANPLTKEQFQNNPSQAATPNPATHTRQKRSDTYYSAGAIYYSEILNSEVNFGGTNNKSEYIGSSKFKGNGAFVNADFAKQLNLKNESKIALNFGGAYKSANRKNISSNSKATRDSMLGFLAAKYTNSDLSVNLAGNFEQVKLKQGKDKITENLFGGEIGTQKSINSQIALFGSLSRSFVVPSVDYAFNWNGGLNPLMKTATFDTAQIGTRAIFGIHTAELVGFYTAAKDEAYYEPQTFENRTFNTERMGLEANFSADLSDKFSANLGYLFVNSKIKNGTHKSAQIPGIAKHTGLLSISYSPFSSLKISSTYKIATAVQDYNYFQNSSFGYAPRYESLDLNISYTRNFKILEGEIYAFGKNLTNHKNAIKVGNSYYADNFQTSFGAGFRAKF